MFKLSIFFYITSELSICNQNLAYFQLLVRRKQVAGTYINWIGKQVAGTYIKWIGKQVAGTYINWIGKQGAGTYINWIGKQV
jgi:hypothetical protein